METVRRSISVEADSGADARSARERGEGKVTSEQVIGRLVQPGQSTNQPEEPRSLVPRPGDAFSFVILKITGQPTTNCGKCGLRKNQMNAWGWIGCLKPVNFKVIKGWIVEEARARGHEITDRQVTGLLRAAFKELRSKK